MNDRIFVSMDNLMGLLPENLATQVDYLMQGLWDQNGSARGDTVFTSLIHAYQDLNMDTKASREWQLPDIHELLMNDRITVVNG